MRGPKGPRRGSELGDLGIISDGSLLIRDGVIQEVGPTRRVENLAAARDAIEISAAGRVVMPGFVDSHTHLVFPPPGPELRDHNAALRAVRTGTCQRIQGRAQLLLEAMARYGTTTVEAKSGSGTDVRCETKLFRVLNALKGHPIDIIPTFLLRLAASDDWIGEEFLAKLRRRRFARFADLVWDPDLVCPALYSRYFQEAKALGFQCKVHADHRTPTAAIALALEHEAVSIDHLEHATEADAARLGGSRTVATLLPYTSLCDDGSHAPGRQLVDAGAAIALASNFNAHHTPTMNMQTVVALACMRMKLTPAEAISAATINGAHALGCADRVGSLEPGKSADLLMLNLSDHEGIAHYFGMNLVHMTMKRGRFIYKEGEVGEPSETSAREWDRTMR